MQHDLGCRGRSTFHSGALQSLTEFFCGHVVAAAAQPEPFKRLAIRAMLFLRAALRASTFRKPAAAVFRLVNGESQQVILWESSRRKSVTSGQYDERLCDALFMQLTSCT